MIPAIIIPCGDITDLYQKLSMYVCITGAAIEGLLILHFDLLLSPFIMNLFSKEQFLKTTFLKKAKSSIMMHTQLS